MEIKYYRAMWGMPAVPLAENLAAIAAAGFDGVEMGAPEDAGERRELRRLLDELGLDLVADVWTRGDSPAEHAHSFEAQYRRAVELGPRLVSAQTGKDTYTTGENLDIMCRAQALEEELGVTVLHEVHRGRATFSTNAMMALLDAQPALRLTADLSHWCCVHESLLSDQAERVARALAHSYHIHARVGHAEGPQVTDPRAPEWAEAVDAHVAWWQQIVNHHRGRDAQVLTITPEFGPPGYMITQPYTRQPIADLWAINVYMMEMLKERLTIQ